MSEYIEREAVLNKIESAFYWNKSYNTLMDEVRDLPFKDNAEVKLEVKYKMCEYCRDKEPRGVDFGAADPDDLINCTVEYRGGNLTVTNSNGDWLSWSLNYCPMCGAKINRSDSYE